MRMVYQYCQLHKAIEEAPACETNYDKAVRFSQTALLPPSERPVVWKHPKTGEVRYPGQNNSEMPKYYKDLGYERHEITSYPEHQKFCKEQGVVNHAVEGIKDEALKS